jgi:hypothetical protein
MREVTRGRSDRNGTSREVSVDTPIHSRPLSRASPSPTRGFRQVRRRLEYDGVFSGPSATALSAKPSISSLSGTYSGGERSNLAASPTLSLSPGGGGEAAYDSDADADADEDADGVADAFGQLSINEYDHVRYHGAASGLHLLGNRPRADTRLHDGIWHFRQGMWPASQQNVQGSGYMVVTELEQQLMAELPPLSVQEHLLELYWTYVHPAVPIVHKDLFMDSFRAGYALLPLCKLVAKSSSVVI